MSSTANDIPDEAWAAAARIAREAVQLVAGGLLPECMPDEPLACGASFALHAVSYYVTLNVLADHQLNEHLAAPDYMQKDIYKSQLAHLMTRCTTDHATPPAGDRLCTMSDEDSVRAAATRFYGPACPECHIAWDKPSPHCPGELNNLHPRART